MSSLFDILQDSRFSFYPFSSSSRERSHSNKNLNTIVAFVCLLIRMLIMDFRVLSLSHTRHWNALEGISWISFKVNIKGEWMFPKKKTKERYVGERRKNTWTKTDLIKLETKEDGWRTLKVYKIFIFLLLLLLVELSPIPSAAELESFFLISMYAMPFVCSIGPQFHCASAEGAPSLFAWLE